LTTRVGKALQAPGLEFDAQGRAWSSLYGDRYASRDGALAQARHVFLAGNALPQRWAGRRQFVIVETGFGLGTNFLATWAAWRGDPQRPPRLHVVSLERHPVRAPDLERAAAALPDDPLRALRVQLLAQWPAPLAGLHRCEFEDGHVVLTLALGDARELAARLVLGADAYYLDGFAPDRNPQMWEPRLVKALARLARPEATVASYTCARAVRDALGAQGFAVERAPGFAGKRQMLRGRYAPRWKMRRREPPAAYDGPMHAIVVGAGLAGCACAYALRRRGWSVTLLERGPQAAAGASALPGGLLYPLLSADDNLASQLVRAGFLHARRMLEHIAPGGAGGAGAEPIWSDCGVFHQAEDPAAEAALRERMEEDGWPEGFAVYRTAAQAAELLGLAPRLGGAWFAGGAVVSSARWCRAMLAALGTGAAVHTDFPAERIERASDLWTVRSAQGRCHCAPVLVLANAAATATLAGLEYAPLQAIGGRVSLLRAPALRELRAGLSGDGYAVPPLLGSAAVGATYEVETPEETPGDTRPGRSGSRDADLEAHAANARRLTALLPGAAQIQVDGVFAARRCVSPDRLPLAGAVVDEAAALAAAQRLRGAQLADLPRAAGLYCLTALGSRGLSLAPLLAELVACTITGEPLPIDARLAEAVDPARFLLRHLR
jgi:tRNA 5-methylaminomethyl-2-thiouridine biosynthesis bifunctional protein